MPNGLSMANCSHIPNFQATSKIRNVHADMAAHRSYNRKMARRGIPKGPVLWYLREWMATMNITKQSRMCELTGWSKAKMSQLYNAEQDFNSEILREASTALNCSPFELMMHPDDAHALRRLREDAIRIAADSKTPFTPMPAEPDIAHRKVG